MPDRVTIKSIARDLGISHMTVSRALSNHPNVQAKTRDAVLRHARALGYVRSAAAKAMRGEGSGIVGLLLPNIVNEFYARFADGMAQSCEAAGLQVIIHLTGDDIGREGRALERLREVQAQAVVMAPAPAPAGFERPHLKAMRVIQLIRQQALVPPVPAVLVDDGPAIRAAVLHLAERGHRKIAFLGADETLSSGRSRSAAFQEGLAAADIEPRPELQCSGAPSFDFGHGAATKLLDDGKATALVCGGVEISNGALCALMERSTAGAQSPAFIGYGDSSFYAWVLGGVSTIRIPVEQLAQQAVRHLIDPEEAGSTDVTAFPADLIVRATSA